jgi:hypothetical protein
MVRSALKVVPAILACLILSAHYLRNFDPIGVIFSLLAPLLLLMGRRWAIRLLQVYLAIGSLVWIDALIFDARVRTIEGRPWLRMAVILGAVALFTLLSAIPLFRYPSSAGKGATA